MPRDESSLRQGLLPIGAVVLDVAMGSEGAVAGLVPGDRILRAGQQPVISAFHCLFLITQRRSATLEMDILRGGVLYRTTLGQPAHALAVR